MTACHEGHMPGCIDCRKCSARIEELQARVAQFEEALNEAGRTLAMLHNETRAAGRYDLSTPANEAVAKLCALSKPASQWLSERIERARQEAMAMWQSALPLLSLEASKALAAHDAEIERRVREDERRKADEEWEQATAFASQPKTPTMREIIERHDAEVKAQARKEALASVAALISGLDERNRALLCPVCKGDGRYLAGNSIWPCPHRALATSPAPEETPRKECPACAGGGVWLARGDEPCPRGCPRPASEPLPVEPPAPTTEARAEALNKQCPAMTPNGHDGHLQCFLDRGHSGEHETYSGRKFPTTDAPKCASHALSDAFMANEGPMGTQSEGDALSDAQLDALGAKHKR